MGNLCQDETLLNAYIDGELSESEAQKVRRHLEGCAPCRQELANLKAADGMIQKLGTLEPSAEFDRTFWRSVDDLEAHHSRRWWTQWIQPGWCPALATGLAAVLVVALFTVTGPGKGVSPDDRFMAENIELLNDYELIDNLEILENWEAMDVMKELT